MAGGSGAKRKTTSNDSVLTSNDSVLTSNDSSTLKQKQKKTNNANAPPLVSVPPLNTSYNDKIRPTLDAVDKLRNLMVMNEGIQLPTIVVVGDQSSGKSSVLESLAGISLPRGQGICTRVPLIMRLQDHKNPNPELYLEFNDKIIHTNEETVAHSISLATEEIAGNKKGISNTPLTLVVRKESVPDLTMVDLPGITRVPVHGQPENIYEQISEMIMEYIKPEESIILNVLSATVDFSTCESIRMSRIVDKSGRRTLAVVTKGDKAPEGLLEKVTVDDVNIGLGYVCVRNRIGDETYEQARMEEIRLFENHHLLSKIDKSIVGVPVLAEKLMQIQATIVAKCLPDIVRKIQEKLNNKILELNKMPKHMTTVPEAMIAFMEIMGCVKESLRKIMLCAEYDEYSEDKQMHAAARFQEMLNHFSVELRRTRDNNLKINFLKEEIALLEESNRIKLPHFLPETAFSTLLQNKVKGISSKPQKIVIDFWNYIEVVFMRVLVENSVNYPQLQTSLRRAAQNLMAKMKEKALNRVIELVEMEKFANYTCFSEYSTEWHKLMLEQTKFLKAIDDDREIVVLGNSVKGKQPQTVVLGNSIGEVGDLDQLRKQHREHLEQAFDLRMRINAYWRIVVRRLVDSIALHLLYDVRNLVNKEMESVIVNEVVGPNGGGLQRMLEEAPAVAAQREKLKKSIDLLRESSDVVSNIVDTATSSGDFKL